MAAAVLAAPAPGSPAQPAPAPDPDGLWREFPLESERPVPAEAAKRGGAARTTSATEAASDRSGRSFPVVQIAGGVLVVAVTLLLLLTGAMAYAGQESLGIAFRRRKRRFERRFRDFVDWPRPAPIPQPRRATVPVPVRRAMRRAEDEVEALAAAAGQLYARLASEVGSRTAALGRRRTSPRDEQTPVPPPVEGRPAAQVGARTSSAPASGDPPASEPGKRPDRTPADDEFDALKAKLAGSRATMVDEREEVERLKAKLGGSPAPRKRETSASDPLKAKLTRRNDAASEARNDAPVERPAQVMPELVAPPQDMPAPRAQQRAGEGRHPARRAGGRGGAAPAALLRTPPTRHEKVVEPAPPIALDPTVPTRCRIVWWRGYLKSLFYAVATTAGGREEILAESPPFRWSKATPPPETPPAANAHRSLIEALERDGWTAVRSGDEWFTVELERRQRRGPRGASRGGAG